MAVIKSFRGWRYNTRRIKDLDEVVVPPYDVISPSDLEFLMKKSTVNFSHIILSSGDGKHERAAKFLKTMIREEVLTSETKPAIYFYRQTFKLEPHELFCQNLPQAIKQGGKLTRTGFFARVGLEDYSAKIIFPHEKTFAKYKDDRYELMKATNGQMEPVFLGYQSDRFSGDEFEKMHVGQKPVAEFVDNADVEHTLWAVTDPKACEEVEKVMASQKLFILDGHHRYETALKFYHDHQKTDARLSHRFVMADVCAFKQSGVIILPTHRGIASIPGYTAQAVLNALKTDFDVTTVKNRAELEAKLMTAKLGAFGLKLKNDPSTYFIALKNPAAFTKFKNLDLEVLHNHVLPRLGDKVDVTYIKNPDELEAKVTKGELQVGFLCKPSTYDEVVRIATSGDTMPHKSTFFYPKIPSGLVINIFE